MTTIHAQSMKSCRFTGLLVVALSLMCGSVNAWAKASPSASVRMLLEDHDHDEEHEGHVEPAANEGEDGNLEGHGEGAEEEVHEGHVEPAADEGEDDILEGHGEGAENNATGTPAATEGDDGVLEGQGEGVVTEASAAWAASGPLALAAAAAAVMAGM